VIYGTPIAIQVLVMLAERLFTTKFVVVIEVIKFVLETSVPVQLKSTFGADENADANVFVTVPSVLLTEVPVVM
jgi:hypothetical protein